MTWGTEKTHFSGELTMIINVDKAGDVALMEVQGSKWSDVEWCRESWGSMGTDMIWDEEDCPKESGKYKVKGKFHCWQDNTSDSYDWDEEFEVKSIELLSGKGEDPMERMLVAFGDVISILQAKGTIFQAWAGNAETLSEELTDWGTSGKGEDTFPSEGIWVWEGEPKEVFKNTDLCGQDYDYTDFSNGKWRKPTALEIALAVKGQMPW